MKCSVVFIPLTCSRVEVHTETYTSRFNIRNRVIRNELLKWPFNIGHETHDDGNDCAKSTIIQFINRNNTHGLPCMPWHDWNTLNFDWNFIKINQIAETQELTHTHELIQNLFRTGNHRQNDRVREILKRENIFENSWKTWKMKEMLHKQNECSGKSQFHCYFV